MKKPPAPTGGQEQKTDFNVPAASSNGWPVASEFRTTWPWQDIDVSTTSALLVVRTGPGLGHPGLSSVMRYGPVLSTLFKETVSQ